MSLIEDIIGTIVLGVLAFVFVYFSIKSCHLIMKPTPVHHCKIATTKLDDFRSGAKKKMCVTPTAECIQFEKDLMEEVVKKCGKK